jgi:proline-specific peptidase
MPVKPYPPGERDVSPQREPWEGRILLPDGYRRFVKRTGPAQDTLVVLHGGPGANHRIYEPLIGIADERLEVVVYDQLDCGDSDWPEKEETWTIEHYVSEFKALVEALGLTRVHVLGQSWGGILALECALQCPELVESLVLCNTEASIESCQKGFDFLVGSRSPATQRAIRENREVDLSDSSDEGRAMIELAATHSRRCTPFDLERSCREFLEFVVPLVGRIGPAYQAMWGNNEFVCSGSLKGWDVRDRLGEISVPTLVICGAYDEVVPECSGEIVAGIKNSRWLILGQSSHMIFHEAESTLALAAIREFI